MVTVSTTKKSMAAAHVFVVLEHVRRRIAHINVTDEPGARWTAQQVINAFPCRWARTRPPYGLRSPRQRRRGRVAQGRWPSASLRKDGRMRF